MATKPIRSTSDVPGLTDALKESRNPLLFPRIWSDLMLAEASPFAVAAISSGTFAVPSPPDANHPGVIRITSSTTTNSGGRFVSATNILLGGLDAFTCVFRPIVTTNTTTRIGLHTATSVSAPTDGIYLEIVEATASAKSTNNSVTTTHGTTYNVSTSTWYRAVIETAAAAASVRYRLFSEAGATLLDVTNAANIPTTRGVALMCTSTNSGTSAQGLTDLDYVEYRCDRQLIR